MFWTPIILPPDPTTIPTLSPLAESVLAMIRQESSTLGGNRQQGSHSRATGSDSLHDTHWNPINVPRTRRDDVYEVSDDWDHQSSVGMNSIPNITRQHAKNYDNSISISDIPTFSMASLPNTRLNSGGHHATYTKFQEDNISSQSYPHIQSRQSKQIIPHNNPYEPFDAIRNNIKSTLNNRDQTFNLSPDMEFDDLKIYSCPFDKQDECPPIKVFDQKSDLNMSLTVKNRINFKEIKPRPLQKRGVQIDSSLTSGKQAKRVAPNQLGLLDQTFDFTSVNNVPKFKTKLATFKNIPLAKPNSDMAVDKNKNYNQGICQGDLLNTNNCRKVNLYQNNIEDHGSNNQNRFSGEQKMFDVNDVFNESLDNNYTIEEDNMRAKLPNVENDLRTEIPASYVEKNHATQMSKTFKENFLMDHQNQEAEVWTKRDALKLSRFAISSSDYDQQKLSINSLEGTHQENYSQRRCNSFQKRVTDATKPKQTAELNSFHPLQSFENNVCTKPSYKKQLDFSQDIFAKTQESLDHSQNNINDIEANQSEELSLPPYQKPVENTNEIETNQPEELSLPPYQKPVGNNVSPTFDVDDLFSLDDKTLDHSSIMFEKNFENTNKSAISNQVKCLPFNEQTGITNILASTNKSAEEFKLNSNLDPHPISKIQNIDPISLNNEDTNLCSPVLKSQYFENYNGNSSTNNQQVSFETKNMKQNNKLPDKERVNKENDKKITMQTNIKNGSKLAVDMGKRNVTAKPLKQRTLFECRKIPPETNSLDSVARNGNETQVNTSLKGDQFKKPLAPVRMGKTSSKLNSVKNKVSLNKNLDNVSKNDSTGNGFLQGNTSLEEIKQKCDPSKLVQTSLIKNEPVKRNAKDTSAKKSKKPCFVPPISASHLTSKDVPLNHHTINVLDDVNANQVLQKLNTEKINNIVTTVTFREGYTLLNKPEEQKKNSRCFPSGVMHMLAWESGRQGYYWLPLSDPAAITPAVVKLVDTLMSKSERNICFEAQAVYMLLMDMLKLKEIHNWDAYDPLIASWLLDPDNPPKDFKEISDKLNMDKNLLVVNPQANTKDQACDLLPVLDVAMNILQNRLVNTSLWTVFTDMETKLIPILAMMESSSILVDMKKLHRTAEAMDKKLRKLQSEAHKLADRWFQLNSPQQLREILFDKLKLDEKFNLKVKKTEHGEKSTSETVLEQMKELHPLPKIILEYRRLQKLKSTYVEGLLQHVKSDGTIGTSWEQVSASTGRITSKNPNLQAFPKCPIDVQDGETVNLREMFIAREGCSFLAADFQQIEFRVFAHFTQDRSLLQAFSEGGDIFQRLAERWLGGKGEEEREKTKRIVYSVMYGAGANKLSEYLHVEPTEAYKIIDNFVAIFPSLRSLPRTVIAKCRTQGFVSALSGRRRLFPNIRSTNGKLRSYSERQAMNFLIQGSAADICKAAMLDCEAEIRSRGLRAKLLLMIHDELIWEVDDRDLQETSKTVKLAMEHRWNERLTLLVPIPVCVSTGKTLANMQ